MNKMIPMVLCAAVMFGCRSRPISPDVSWSDYGQYYSPTGEVAVPPQAPAGIQVVKAKQADSAIAALQAQGYVVLGKFLIADDTEITRPAVAALAEKLNAGEVVWTVENVVGADSALPNNPDQGIAGVDTVQMAHMNVSNPEMSLADQAITHRHTIWMLGKKK